MKVLILCDLFPPAFGPRMGYLCKYLRRSGWEPTVITEYIPGEEMFASLKGDTEVVYVRYYRARKPLSRRMEWLAGFVLDILFDCKNRRMRREAFRQLRKQPFRLILCSTFRTFPLPAACTVARKARLPLVADLRDMVEQTGGRGFISHPLPKLRGLERWMASAFLKHTQRQRNRALRQAACLTTVSHWHVDLLRSYGVRVELIYNGYDPELFYPAPVRSRQFFITYTGRIVDLSLRNPDLLFRAVERLAREGLITPDAFRIRWFTDAASRRLLQREAEGYAILPYMDFFDCVPATQVPALLNESAILLLLAGGPDASGPKGIMTTKFFEALAVEKPILCVHGDRGCLEEAIKRTRAGLSAHDVEEVCRFILTHYRQWQLTGETGLEVNRREIRKYSRQAQAHQFIRIFEEISDTR